MHYEEARERGDEGEHVVHDVLRSHAHLGYRPVDNLLFRVGGKTTQMDHVIVDRYGILVIETKTWRGILRGKSKELRWTVCAKQNYSHLNPLEQNELHRKRLHELLAKNGHDLPTQYVQSLIVFVAGDIAHLDLDEIDKMRVVSGADGLIDFLQARYDFAPNEGALSAEEVDSLVRLLNLLDCSNDPEVAAQHGRNVDRASARFKPKEPVRRPSHVARSGQRPVSPPRGKSFAGSPEPVEALKIAVALLVVGAMFGGWLVSQSSSPRSLGGGPPSVALVNPQPSVAVSRQPKVDAALAYERLREADPKIAKAVTNRHEPQVASQGSYTSYTWQYLSKKHSNVVQIKTITIKLDASGQIRGAD